MSDSADTISSIHNPRVRDAIKLRDRKHRNAQRQILIDGAREIRRAMEAKVAIRELFICAPLLHGADGAAVVQAASDRGIRLSRVTPAIFSRLAYGERADGALAVADTPETSLAVIPNPSDSLVCVLVGLEKPGNVGAVLRSADAAGVGGLIVADPVTDLFNPNCIRASLATVFTVPTCTATSDQTREWLRENGYRAYAATVGAPLSYLDADFRGRVAIVLGSEASGLDPTWQNRDVTPISLPMLGTADSLNVSATAAVLFYEAQRQRRTAGRPPQDS